MRQTAVGSNLHFLRPGLWCSTEGISCRKISFASLELECATALTMRICFNTPVSKLLLPFFSPLPSPLKFLLRFSFWESCWIASGQSVCYPKRIVGLHLAYICSTGWLQGRVVKQALYSLMVWRMKYSGVAGEDLWGGMIEFVSIVFVESIIWR